MGIAAGTYAPNSMQPPVFAGYLNGSVFGVASYVLPLNFVKILTSPAAKPFLTIIENFNYRGDLF